MENEILNLTVCILLGLESNCLRLPLQSCSDEAQYAIIMEKSYLQ